MPLILRLTSLVSITKLVCKRQRIFVEQKICRRKLNRSFSSCTEDDDMSKIGINGFGRIGRLVLRASIERGAQVSNYILIITYIC